MVFGLDYFETRVTKIPCVATEDWIPNVEGDCWMWKLALTGAGHPTHSDRSVSKTKCQCPARALWRIVMKRPLTDSKVFLCHNCPNKLCINPAHRYEGDAKTNRADEVNRRRVKAYKIGEHREEIIKLFKEGIEQQEIAKRLNVCRATIQRLLNGNSNQVPHDYVQEAEDKRNDMIRAMVKDGKKLTHIMKETKIPATVIWSVCPEIRKWVDPDQSKNILKDKEEGMSIEDIADKYKVHKTTVYGVIRKNRVIPE